MTINGRVPEHLTGTSALKAALEAALEAALVYEDMLLENGHVKGALEYKGSVKMGMFRQSRTERLLGVVFKVQTKASEA